MYMFAQRGCPTSRATASAIAPAAFRMSLSPYFRRRKLRSIWPTLTKRYGASIFGTTSSNPAALKRPREGLER